MRKKKKLNFWILGGLILIFELTHSGFASGGEVVKNYGISFGINGVIFIFLDILFVLFLIYFFNKIKSLGIGLMLGGGLINLGDRFVFGYVRDYWYFFGVYNNLADWLIGVGVLLCFIEYLWIKKK